MYHSVVSNIGDERHQTENAIVGGCSINKIIKPVFKIGTFYLVGDVNRGQKATENGTTGQKPTRTKKRRTKGYHAGFSVDIS